MASNLAFGYGEFTKCELKKSKKDMTIVQTTSTMVRNNINSKCSCGSACACIFVPLCFVTLLYFYYVLKGNYRFSIIKDLKGFLGELALHLNKEDVFKELSEERKEKDREKQAVRKISIYSTLREWFDKENMNIRGVISNLRYSNVLSIAQEYMDVSVYKNYSLKKLYSDYEKIHSVLKELKKKTGNLLKKKKEEEELNKNAKIDEDEETPDGNGLSEEQIKKYGTVKEV